MHDSVKQLKVVILRNFLLSAIVTGILSLGAEPSHSQENSSNQASAEADSGAADSEAPVRAEGEAHAPALASSTAAALSWDAETASLVAERDAATARIAQMASDLATARTLTDKLSGQVRDAQLIIRALEAQRASLEAKMGDSEGGECPEPGGAVERAASAPQVDALRAQVAACTEGANPDAALQARVDDLSSQVAAISAERDALQARLDAAQAVDKDGGGTGGEMSEDTPAPQPQIETRPEGELMADLSDALEAVTTLTQQRDRALEDADAAKAALAEAAAERDGVQEQLAEAEAGIAELRDAAVTASGALTVCENSPVAGGVVLADEPTARAFKAGLGVLGNDMELLVSPVPTNGIACVLQPIDGLLAPASQRGNAFVADYGTSVQVVDALPRSKDCGAILETTAVQDMMAGAEGFGSAKRVLWVQDAGAPALCGSRNGQVGLLRVEPRNQSAVFFLTAQTF